MTRRRHICDVAGCTNERKRWQRICDRCFGLLNAETRGKIIGSYRLGNRRQHSKLIRDAGVTLGLVKPKPGAMPSTNPAGDPPPSWQDRADLK